MEKCLPELNALAYCTNMKKTGKNDSFRPISIALDAAKQGKLTGNFLPDWNTLTYFAKLGVIKGESFTALDTEFED